MTTNSLWDIFLGHTVVLRSFKYYIHHIHSHINIYTSLHMQVKEIQHTIEMLQRKSLIYKYLLSMLFYAMLFNCHVYNTYIET